MNLSCIFKAAVATMEAFNSAQPPGSLVYAAVSYSPGDEWTPGHVVFRIRNTATHAEAADHLTVEDAAKYESLVAYYENISELLAVRVAESKVEAAVRA